MRFLLIILLLANIALYLYARSNETPPTPSPPLVAADQIVLLKSLAENEPAPTVFVPTAAAEAATPCLEWGPFAEAQLDSARSALNRAPDLRTYQEIRRPGPARSWLVSLDGFSSRAVAATRVNELRRHGIEDISVLEPGQEAGSAFMLSLGVFSTEQGALSRVASLNEKKVNNVKVTPRGSSTFVFFAVPNTSPALAQHLRELSARFTDSAVRDTTCPAPQTP